MFWHAKILLGLCSFASPCTVWSKSKSPGFLYHFSRTTLVSSDLELLTLARLLYLSSRIPLLLFLWIFPHLQPHRRLFSTLYPVVGKVSTFPKPLPWKSPPSSWLCGIVILHTHHPKFLNMPFCQQTTLEVRKLSTTLKFWRNFTNSIKSRNNDFKWNWEKLIVIRKHWAKCTVFRTKKWHRKYGENYKKVSDGFCINFMENVLEKFFNSQFL